MLERTTSRRRPDPRRDRPAAVGRRALTSCCPTWAKDWRRPRSPPGTCGSATRRRRPDRRRGGTAKAAVEVPIPFAGTVTALHAELGTTVPVGVPLTSVTIRRTGGTRPGRTRARRMTASPTAAADEASGTCRVGYGPGHRRDAPEGGEVRGLRRRDARSGRCHRRGRRCRTGSRRGRRCLTGSRRGRRRLAAGSRRSPRADAGRPGAGHLTDRAQARPPGRA